MLPFLAYCDEDGWTVFQRRFGGDEDEALNFFRFVVKQNIRACAVCPSEGLPIWVAINWTYFAGTGTITQEASGDFQGSFGSDWRIFTSSQLKRITS